MTQQHAPVFETNRLTIRIATPEDAAMYFSLWTNPAVTTNVGFPYGIPTTLPEISDTLYAQDKARQQDDSPFGKLLVVGVRATGETIGECKMYLPDAQGIAKTDVKLLPDFWGHKYGVEVKRGLVDHLFTHSDCAVVQATPNVKNAASIKMQEAVGGKRVGEAVFEPPPEKMAYLTSIHYYIYHVFREDWEKRRTHTATPPP